MARIRVYIILVLCWAAASLFISTQPVIFAEEAISENALRDIFPGAVTFEPVKSAGNILYYKAYGASSVFVGVVFKVTQKGYSGTIETMAGMRRDGTITAIKVLSQDETPGVGAKVTEDAFTGQFKGRNARELDNVADITGATISSRAVTDSVKKRAGEIMELLSKQE